MDSSGYLGIFEYFTFGSILISCFVFLATVLWFQRHVTASRDNVGAHTAARADAFAQKWPLVTGKVDATKVIKKKMLPICKNFNDERR